MHLFRPGSVGGGPLPSRDSRFKEGGIYNGTFNQAGI